MTDELTINGLSLRFDSNKPIDISIPLNFNGRQPNAYGVEPAIWIANRRAVSALAPSTTASPNARKRSREGAGAGRPSRYLLTSPSAP